MRGLIACLALSLFYSGCAAADDRSATEKPTTFTASGLVTFETPYWCGDIVDDACDIFNGHLETVDEACARKLAIAGAQVLILDAEDKKLGFGVVKRPTYLYAEDRCGAEWKVEGLPHTKGTLSYVIRPAEPVYFTEATANDLRMNLN